MSWEALTVSTASVALAEIGDKTQLLALLLAARYRRPVPIILGMLVATLVNHAAASAIGMSLTRWIDPVWLRWVLGLSFIAVAAWMLVPDRIDESTTAGPPRLGVFGVTVLTFFLAEMGDKTQIATVMLAAKYESIVAVTSGTTLGMMIANVPAVLLGERVVRRVPVVWIHRVAAGVFLVLGLLVLLGIGGGVGVG